LAVIPSHLDLAIFPRLLLFFQGCKVGFEGLNNLGVSRLELLIKRIALFGRV